MQIKQAHVLSNNNFLETTVDEDLVLKTQQLLLKNKFDERQKNTNNCTF